MNKIYFTYRGKKYVWDINRFKEHMFVLGAIIFLIVIFLFASGEDYEIITQ